MNFHLLKPPHLCYFSPAAQANEYSENSTNAVSIHDQDRTGGLEKKHLESFSGRSQALLWSPKIFLKQKKHSNTEKNKPSTQKVRVGCVRSPSLGLLFQGDQDGMRGHDPQQNTHKYPPEGLTTEYAKRWQGRGTVRTLIHCYGQRRRKMVFSSTCKHMPNM